MVLKTPRETLLFFLKVFFKMKVIAAMIDYMKIEAEVLSIKSILI